MWLAVQVRIAGYQGVCAVKRDYPCQTIYWIDKLDQVLSGEHVLYLGQDVRRMDEAGVRVSAKGSWM